MENTHSHDLGETSQALETAAPTPATVPSLEVTTSRQMPAWLAEQKLSLALTTYQIGKLFFIGLKSCGELSVFERSFNGCMGLCPTNSGLYLSSLYQLWRFKSLFTAGEAQDGFGIHDMAALDADGGMVIDLHSGDAGHWLRFEGAGDGLYDGLALPAVRRPMALDLKTDEIRRVVNIAG